MHGFIILVALTAVAGFYWRQILVFLVFCLVFRGVVDGYGLLFHGETTGMVAKREASRVEAIRQTVKVGLVVTRDSAGNGWVKAVVENPTDGYVRDVRVTCVVYDRREPRDSRFDLILRGKTYRDEEVAPRSSNRLDVRIDQGIRSVDAAECKVEDFHLTES